MRWDSIWQFSIGQLAKAMKFANKYELFEAVTSGRVETFFAKDLASGERVLLHIFEAPEKKPEQPTVLWVLESFRRVAPNPPGLVLETGRYSGTTYAYLVTKLPDNAALKLWTRSYESPGAETQEIAIPSLGAAPGVPAISKDLPRPNEQPAEASAPMPSAELTGDFTAAFSELVSPVSPRSEATGSRKTGSDEINFGSERTAALREPGDFTRQFFSGSPELPQTPATHAPAKPAAEATSPLPLKANPAQEAALDGIDFGPEQAAPRREPGDFTRQFFSGSPELPQKLSTQAPAKLAGEAIAPLKTEVPRPKVPSIGAETQEAANAEATASPPPNRSPSGDHLTASPAVSPDAGAFTALFQSSFKPESKVASEGVGLPSKSTEAKEGNFTDFFRGPFDGERPAETPNILPKASDAPRRNAPGEFTRVFGSGKSGDLAVTPPLQDPIVEAPRGNEPGAFTQIFSNTSQPAAPSLANAPLQTWEPVATKSEPQPSMEPAWTSPPPLPAKPPVTPSIEPILPQPTVSSTLREAEPSLPAGATHVFSAPVRSPVASPPPLPTGPSEYTRIISGGMGAPSPAEGPIAGGSPRPSVGPPGFKLPAAPPAPAAPKVAAPPPPKLSPPAAPSAPKAPQLDAKAPKAKASYLPLVIVLNLLLFVAILLIVYFAVKH